MQRVSLAVHVLLVGASETPTPALKRDRVLSYVGELVCKTTDTRCSSVWFGRLFVEALSTECEFESCTIDHSQNLLDTDGKTLQHLRLSVASDFRTRKHTRRAAAEPACATAYHLLLEHAQRLCSDVLDPEHDCKTCTRIHLQNLTSREPVALAKSSSHQEDIVCLLLGRYVEKARKENGALDAKALVRSDELLNTLDNALSHSGLQDVVRSKSVAGGEFSRHGIGRAISSSRFWGAAKRDAKGRGFRGFRLKRPRPNLEQLQNELLEAYSAADGHDTAELTQPPQTALPPVPAADGGPVTLTRAQYAFLLSSARANAERQHAADTQRVARLDQQLAALQAQRAAAAADAARSSGFLAGLRL